jgi:hypothetical protein
VLMQRWLLLTMAAIPFLFSVARPSPPPLTVWTTHALDKIRPYDKVPDKLNESVQLLSARNEFESFQVVFHADLNDVNSIDIEVSPLKGPGGASIRPENITVYFERFLDLPKPSSIEGAAGEWPDPLIPKTDRYAQEKRNAFPFNLAKRRNQPIWIEIYVPTITPPGVYRGTVKVSVGDLDDAVIPVTLEVGRFSIASTSSLPNTFGFSGIGAVRQHLGKYTNDADVRRYTFMYRQAGLLHRLSFHGGSMTPPPFQVTNGGIEIDWKHYDEEVGPFLDGRVFGPDQPLPGARATTVELPTNRVLQTDQQRILYWRAVANHFRQRGWIDRLFNYLWDEPKPESYGALLDRGRLVHAADPGLKNLVTAPFNEKWTNVIDIWVPVVNCFTTKPGAETPCDQPPARAGYEAELSKGGKLWSYQSCLSHGCQIVGGEYFRGWPSYVIDTASVANRIMPWVTWKYRIGGELYYNTDEMYSRRGDAWTDVYLFGGNGDGTLFYPGRPRVIGGMTDIPIESIRLKLIREGLEDYEYLVLLSRLGRTDLASRFVDQLVTNAYTYDRDPANFYKVRRNVWEQLNKLATVTNE